MRYSSTQQARGDLVVSLLSANATRAWAWDLLRLPSVRSSSAQTAVRETVQICVAEAPGSLVPLLADVARSSRLPTLLRWLGHDEVQRLVQAAWTAAGGTAIGTGQASMRRVGVRATSHHRRLADLVRQRSVIWASLRSEHGFDRQQSLPHLSGTEGHSAEAPTALISDGQLARLALLEVEPALAAAPTAEQAVAELTARIEGPSQADDASVEGTDGQATDGMPARPERADKRQAAGRRFGDRSAEPGSTDSNCAEMGSSDLGQQADGSTAEQSADDPSDPQRAGSEVGEPARLVSSTAWGGLLFLLIPLDHNGFPARVAAAPDKFGLGVRRALFLLGHELIRRAAPGREHADREDAGVLAFCGLAPDATAPSEDVEAPGWVDVEVAALVTDLRRRLSGRPLGDASEAALLRRVLLRRGRVYADPGWIDLDLDLDAVDFDVRRAGLDLDPGYLPWLGVVVRFRYV